MNSLSGVLLLILLLVLLLGVVLGGSELFNPQQAATRAAEAAERLREAQQRADLAAQALARRYEIDLTRYERESQLKTELWGWPAQFLVVSLGFAALLVSVCVAYYVICLAVTIRQREAAAHPSAQVSRYQSRSEAGTKDKRGGGQREEDVDLPKAA